MDGFQHIDLNKAIHIGNYNITKELLNIGLDEQYSYSLDTYRTVVGWKNESLYDLVIEIFEDDIEEYIIKIYSKDLNIIFDLTNDSPYCEYSCEQVINFIKVKLAKYFNLDNANQVTEYIMSFFDSAPSDDVDDEYIDEDLLESVRNDSMDDTPNAEYEYSKYIFAFFDAHRKYGNFNNILDGADHIKTLILDNFELYDCGTGDGKLVALIDSANINGAVADIYRVDYAVIEDIMSKMPDGIKKLKIPETDIWYFSHSDSEYVKSNFEKVKLVNEIYGDEKYATCDFADGLEYLKTKNLLNSGYDIIDSFAPKLLPPPTTNKPLMNDDDTGEDIYTEEQYKKIVSEFDKYLDERRKNGLSVPSSIGTLEYDNMFMDWYISDDARSLRTQIESLV